MRILVTGASGLLGSTIALQAAEDHTMIGVVNSQLIATDQLEVRKADLLIPGAVAKLLEETQPDLVIHCAALADLEVCEEYPEMASRMNADIPGQIAEITARTGIQMIHISTDAVFDGKKGFYTEEDETNPLSVYTKTKLAGEKNVTAFNPRAIIARVNFYGWSVNGNRSLSDFFYNNLSAGKQINGFTDIYFSPLLVNDLAKILIQMAEKKLNGLYHVVSPEKLSKYEFGQKIAEKFGFDSRLITAASIQEAKLKAPRSPNLTLNVDKVTQELGFQLPSIDAGLEKFYQLYQENYPDKIKNLVPLLEDTHGN
jgi:dTDP-4-dehydrorhamnose reductase